MRLTNDQLPPTLGDPVQPVGKPKVTDRVWLHSILWTGVGILALITILTLMLFPMRYLEVWMWVFPPQAMSTTFESSSARGLIQAERATTTLCANFEDSVHDTRPRCIEAWHTSVGNYLRFASIGEAEYWHYVIGGDSIRDKHHIVLDMNGFELTSRERELAVGLLFPGRDWQ